MYSCKVCAYRDEKFYQSCPVCGATNSFIDEDMDILQQLSCSQQLIDAMKKLRETDIIEYELKMSQFRTQYEQQQSLKQTQNHIQQSNKSDNRPKCPTCGSTNIQKISATRKAMGAIGFGLLSKTARSQFECLDCKCKW